MDAVFVAPAFVEPAFVAPFDFAAVDEFAEVDDDASSLTTFVTGKPFLSVTTLMGGASTALLTRTATVPRVAASVTFALIAFFVILFLFAAEI